MAKIGLGLWIACSLLVSAPALGAHSEGYAVMLPLTCAELLPDMTPYIQFFDAVGRAEITKDRRFSKRIYRILALRENMLDLSDRGREQNPIDLLVRKTLCFYREQKDPIRPISYDDPEFTKFLKTSIKELETKVEKAVFDWELERQERKEFERRAKQNQKLVNALEREADIEAAQTFSRLSQRAKQKAMRQ